MINVVDEVLNKAATDNKVKYRITHEDGTTELVQIDLATPVTTQGTPQNKSLFDAIQEFLMTSSDPQTVSVTEKAANTGDGTQTAYLTVSGRRYYLFTISGSTECMFGLYDSKANKFIIGGYYGRYPDSVDNTFAVNSSQLGIHDRSNATVKMTCSLSGTTLTLTFAKHPTSSSKTKSATITVYELGGFLM